MARFFSDVAERALRARGRRELIATDDEGYAACSVVIRDMVMADRITEPTLLRDQHPRHLYAL
jgi:hypothetical protein